MNKLSENIKLMRLKKGYTQKELAEMLEVGQTTIANYEQGKRIPDADKIRKLGDIFNVSIDYLLGRESIWEDKKEFFSEKEDYFEVYLAFLLNGDSVNARNMIIELYEKGMSIGSIYFNIFSKTLKKVGTLWESGELDVWKEHFISEVTLDIMRDIKAREKRKMTPAKSIVGFTSGAETHSIGLKMVLDMLEIEGFHTLYLGSNVPVQSILNAIEASEAYLVAISVTMPYHIEAAKNTITAIKNKFKEKAPKIVIGGNAFENDTHSWSATGADYYSKNSKDMLDIMGR